MNYRNLEKNITDVVTEMQIKMNFRSAVTLFYPEEEVASLLKTTLPVEERDVASYFTPRGIDVKKDGRFCFTVSEERCKEIGIEGEKGGFLPEFTALTARHDCTAEEVIGLFQKYSSCVHIERKKGEFDYLLYFEDGKPNDYRYCLTEEGGHVDCHRFTPERYASFGF